MSNACTPILVGVAIPVSEILLLSKTANFPFQTMDYSPWSSKNSIDRNQLKKFKQVGIDVKCMHTNFGGCGLFGFGDTATFKNSQISLCRLSFSLLRSSIVCLRGARSAYHRPIHSFHSLDLALAEGRVST